MPTRKTDSNFNERLQQNSLMKSIGFNFNNSYFALTEMMMAKVLPTKVKDPKLAILNHELAKQLGLNFSSLNPQQLAELFTGNALPEGASPIAQAYAGHQFGHLVILGELLIQEGAMVKLLSGQCCVNILLVRPCII